MEIEQDDVVLCAVEEIIGTTVFVKIEGLEKTGSIVFSEIAPGRIRNIREYVVPKKIIVCKVLKINQDNIELSLRRVKEKEKKELLEKYKLEKSYVAILKSVLKEKTNNIIKEIKSKSNLYDFLEESKENSKILDEIVGKDNSKKIQEILMTQKKKTISLKKDIEFYTQKNNGLHLIKEVLGKIEGIEVTYISAGKYSLKREDEDIKKADQKLMQIILNLEKEAKKHEIEFKYKQ